MGVISLIIVSNACCFQEAGEDYYDDYEDDGYGQGEDVDEEEEEGEQYAEEDPNPTKEELEFLEYRQKRKEQIRKRLKGKGAPSQNRSSDKNKLPYDKWVTSVNIKDLLSRDNLLIVLVFVEVHFDHCDIFC